MDTFLKYLASKLKSDTKNLCVVFPNQRAGVYFKQYFKERNQNTLFIPQIFTFDSFVEYLNNTKKTPKIELLFILYEAYKSVTPQEDIDSFEQFIVWGKTVLEDFNIIDLYLSSRDKVFGQLKDINIIHNWEPETSFSQKYLLFLQNLKALYYEFIDQLKTNNKTYQGLLFREAAETIQLFIEHTNQRIIFAGFNFFTPSEWSIVNDLLDAGKAELYWNLPKTYDFLYSQYNFIKPIAETQWTKGIHYKTKKTDTSIQVIESSQLSNTVKYSVQKLGESSNNTAIIPLNQQLINSLLESIPKDVSSLNITMGIPIKIFSTYNFIKTYFNLISYFIQNTKGYYYKDLINFLDHPFTSIFSKEVKSLKKLIISNGDIYIPKATLAQFFQQNDSPLKSLLIFKKNSCVQDYLQILNKYFVGIRDLVSDTEREVIFHFYTINNQLSHWLNKYKQDFTLNTFFNLYNQLVSSENINFIGEPLEGLQILGFREMQCLTFDTVIALQANEGYLPTSDKRPTYMPYDIRLQHGLPTHENLQGMEAMIFAHILDNSKAVDIHYSNSMDTFGAQELSRFVKQLTWNSPSIANYSLNANPKNLMLTAKAIDKNDTIKKKLVEWMTQGISPSALNNYIYNPFEFYKQYILKIQEDEDIQETIEQRLLGTVVHETLQDIYTPYVGQYLNSKTLEEAAKMVDSLVVKKFSEAYTASYLFQGMNYLIVKIAQHFVTRFIKDEVSILKEGHRIKILSLEDKTIAEYTSENLPFSVRFKGTVDRVDEFDNVLRIIDYKTGKVEGNDLNATNFEEKITDKKYSKALQLIIYAYCYAKEHALADNHIFKAGIFSFKKHQAGFLTLFTADSNKKTLKESDKKREFNSSDISQLITSVDVILLELLSLDNHFLEKID